VEFQLKVRLTRIWNDLCQKMLRREHGLGERIYHTAHKGSRRQPTFNALQREDSFKNPSRTGATYPILNGFVKPHIESFNALFGDSGLPKGDGEGRGLLSLGLKDRRTRHI